MNPEIISDEISPVNPPILVAQLAPEEEGLRIRKALRCFHQLDVRALWIDSLIAHVQGKRLIERPDDLCSDRIETNIKPYLVNGMGILLTMFAVDEDLEFVHHEHKFDTAGFRKTESAELLKPVEQWSPDYDENDYILDDYIGDAGFMTAGRRKRVLELLTSTGLLDRKPDINRTTLVIRLRGDRIIDALKRISPRGYADLNY